MNLDVMFHNGMDPYATMGAVPHVPKKRCRPIIVTDFQMFYVLREIYVFINISYFTQVLWELFLCMNIRTF